MRVLEVARLLGVGAIFRASGAEPAGRALVEALRSNDETARGIAATMLVRAGAKACPVLRRAVTDERSLPIVLSMLGDVGDASDEARLLTFSAHPDVPVQTAAMEALRVLRARRPGPAT